MPVSTADLLALLPAQKAALLAIEKAGAKEASDAVTNSTSSFDSYKAARKQLRAIQIVAGKLAIKHVKAEFGLLGIPLPKTPKPDTAFIDKALADLKISLLSKLTQQQKALRASLAATVIANRAYSDMQVAMYKAAMINQPKLVIHKMWVANFSQPTKPCSYCTQLHGKVVSIDEEFPAPHGLKVYSNLESPPAHIRCRCKLIAKLVVAT